MVQRSRQHAHLERARTISSSPGPNETSALLRAFLVRINSQQERQHQQTQLRESSPPRTPSPPASSSALPRTPSPISRSSYIPPRTPRSRRRNDTREAAERNILLTPPRRRRPARVFTTPISPISRSQRVFATPRSQQRGLSGRRQATQLATPTRTRQRAQPAQGSTSAPPNITTAGFYYAAPVQTQAWKPQQDVARTPLQQNIDYRFILATATHSCTLCGALYWIEERKVSTTKIKPQFTCCVNGAVQIPPQPQYPAVLQKLLADCVPGEQRRTRRSVEFHQFIRHYNNSFSFCSLGAEIDDQLARQLTGVYTFRAHGQLYHRIGSLRAQGNTNPSFAQLYIFDSDEEQLQLRQRAFPNLNTQILRTIQQCLTTNHPFVRAFKTNAERIRRDNSKTLRIGIVESANTDPRVYNRPTAREVGALIPTSGGASEGTRQIVLENRANAGLKFISEQLPEYTSPLSIALSAR